MNTRNFLKTIATLPLLTPFISTGKTTPVDKYEDPEYGHWYKTPDSIFTAREINDFCKEWGWIHVDTFIKQTSWIDDHKPPYIWCTYGVGQFLGVDGNKYMTWNTYRTQWIGEVRSTKGKDELKKYLKSAAGDYYWKGKREHYYFYDVLLTGRGTYDCQWPKKFEPGYEPNEAALEYHGQPYYNVILHHMGVPHGKPWGYIEDKV